MTITNGYTTLDAIKALKRITSTDTTDDGVIEALVTQVSRYIDIATGRTFYARTETRYFDVPGGRSLYVDDDLLTVTTLTNGDATVVSSTDYRLFPLNVTPKWEIRLKESSAVHFTEDSSGNVEGVITVAGTWGYSSTTPGAIKEACEQIVINAYNRRFGENTTGAAVVTAAGVVITPDDVPSTAAEILSHYRALV